MPVLHTMLPAARRDEARGTGRSPVPDVVARAGGAGRTVLVGATCNACAEVASRRQRSWQRMCARSQRTHWRAGSRARADDAHWAGRSTCAVPSPRAHPEAQNATEVVVELVRARAQQQRERNGGGPRCAPRGVRLLHRAMLNSLAGAPLVRLAGVIRDLQLALGARLRASVTVLRGRARLRRQRKATRVAVRMRSRPTASRGGPGAP